MFKYSNILISSIFLLFGIFGAGRAEAATISAASCSYADVQSAISGAQNGDTVSIPECATKPTNWGANELAISKSNITIEGAGIGETVISGTGKAIKSTVGESANNLRITGLEFRDFTFAIWTYNNHSESIKNLRVDHCKFNQVYIAYENYGRATGVFDSNIFEDVVSTAVRLFGDDDESAAFPFVMGTGDAMFFENNSYLANNVCPPHFIASRVGSRYVVRHNTFTYNKSGCGWTNAIDAHGTYEGSDFERRGSFTWELYSNTFNGSAGINGSSFHFRGGQGIVYDNIVESWTTNMPKIVLTDYRLMSGDGYEGWCTSYPCRDQINHTYLWNNTLEGNPWHAISNYPEYIQEGRDYFECGTKEHCVDEHGLNYTPYAYPHPLTLSGGDTITPSIPSGLSVK